VVWEGEDGEVRTWTYAELRRKADDLARALLSVGIRKGDRVGIWSPNNAEWLLAQFATPKIGAILVNINPAYRTSELSSEIVKSASK
jgi:fatty-acyl-CoA synthase